MFRQLGWLLRWVFSAVVGVVAARLAEARFVEDGAERAEVAMAS